MEKSKCIECDELHQRRRTKFCSPKCLKRWKRRNDPVFLAKEKLYTKKYNLKQKQKLRQLEGGNEKIFGIKGKQANTDKPIPQPEVADLEVPSNEAPEVVPGFEQPQHIGMPGFTPDKPSQPVEQPKPVMEKVNQPSVEPKLETYNPVTPGIPQPQDVVPEVPQLQPVVHEVPQPVVPVQGIYKVVGIEEIQEGVFKYVLITNKHLGDIGKEYNC